MFCNRMVLALALMLAGCSAKDPAMEGSPNNSGGAGTPGGAGTTGGNAGSGESGRGEQPGGGAGTTSGGNAGSSAGSGAQAGSGGSDVDPMVVEMLDPDVDWTALTLVYPTAYSAFDGEHVFQVPFYVDGADVELSDWSAIPASAVSFDEDPDSNGVLVTVLEDEPEITIAARSGSIGGTAVLHITSGTPAQWEVGQARYANGVELNIDTTITLEEFQMMLMDPNWTPPTPPPDLACNNCHTTGAKYFEIQHTPTQAARFSDDDLRTIFTTGTKPPGVGFRVIPEMLFNQSAEEVYMSFHKWEATEDEIIGMIIYLRSLTPTGQGDILLPDGSYAPPGMLPMTP